VGRGRGREGDRNKKTQKGVRGMERVGRGRERWRDTERERSRGMERDTEKGVLEGERWSERGSETQRGREMEGVRHREGERRRDGETQREKEREA